MAYVRWHEIDPTDPNPTIDVATKNIYSLHVKIGALRDEVQMGIAFDPAIIQNKTCQPFFNDLSNKWTRYFTDMEAGGLSCGENIATAIFGSFSALYEGAVPASYCPCGYHYVDYDVTVFAKKNPSFYQIKSFDISDAIMGTETVLPSTDLSSLSLPAGRSYSVVEEYLNGSLISTSEKIRSGGMANLYFSNSSGFFDRATSEVTL